MTIRLATTLTCGFVALCAIGCGDSNTQVSKKLDDAYHAHDAGPRPPAGAMANHVSAVGPFANSGGVPPGMTNGPKTGGVPAGQGSGGAQ